MDFLLATKNKHKIAEMARILAPLDIRVVGETACGVTLPEVEETGSTFAENALLKARSACAVSGLPSIADDSGLCVDGLDGAPGVLSARFAGEGHNDRENIDKLLDLLSDVPVGDPRRNAHFACAVCCCFPDGTTVTTEGRCDGVIATERHGDNGFGYDPVFLYGEMSFAQMDGAAKDAVSHRGRALSAFLEKLKEKVGEKYADK